MIDIGIVGAGAWGTALGITLGGSGQRVALWGRDVAALTAERENRRHLPGIVFPEHLGIVHHLEALAACPAILLAVPAQTVREVAAGLRAHVDPACRIVLCAKGIERETGKLLSAIVEEELPGNPVAVLSGPSFAAELAAGKPTAATLAALDEEIASSLAATLSNRSLRLYHSTDLVGVELAGALKNVVAIACGIVIGRGLGENARAALMTRGLAEIARIGVRLGGRAETFMGLSGLGDLALTATSLQSRNFSLGVRVGQGEDATAAASGGLVEGMATAQAVLALAARHDIPVPIARGVHAVLEGTASIEETMAALMARPLKMESE